KNMTATQPTTLAPVVVADDDRALLQQMLDDYDTALRPQTEQELCRGRDYLQEFLRQVVRPEQMICPEVETTLQAWVAEIDKKLSGQLNEVMHHPDFQKLEGTWRGLHYLVHQSETGEDLKIRVLNVKKKELEKDLKKAVEFDMSALFKKV